MPRADWSLVWSKRLRQKGVLNLFAQQGKQMLTDGFVNAIYLFDDYAIITCNYKDGEERITFVNIENSELLEYIKNKPEHYNAA